MKILIFGLLFTLGLALAKEYDHHSFKKFDYPERSFAIIMTKEGYYPNRVVAFEGEKLRFFLTSTLKEPQCLLLKGHELFMSSELGKVVEGEVVFEQPGEFRYYCPGYPGVGKVVVLGKGEQNRKTHKLIPAGRSLASELPSEQWVPRDE